MHRQCHKKRCVCVGRGWGESVGAGIRSLQFPQLMEKSCLNNSIAVSVILQTLSRHLQGTLRFYNLILPNIHFNKHQWHIATIIIFATGEKQQISFNSGIEHTSNYGSQTLINTSIKGQTLIKQDSPGWYDITLSQIPVHYFVPDKDIWSIN